MGGCGKPEGAKGTGYALFLSFKLPQMKKLIFLIVIIIASCQSKQENSVKADSINESTTNVKHFYFGAILYTYLDYDNHRKRSVYVGDIVEAPYKTYLSEDGKYKWLDDLSKMIVKRDFQIEYREVYDYSSYTEASKERQKISNSGIIDVLK